MFGEKSTKPIIRKPLKKIACVSQEAEHGKWTFQHDDNLQHKAEVNLTVVAAGRKGKSWSGTQSLNRQKKNKK